MAIGIKQDMNMCVLIHLREAFLTLDATKSYTLDLQGLEANVNELPEPFVSKCIQVKKHQLMKMGD